jgi:anti-sigma regulatory factor (Ser/Thr protein kinase)
MAGAAIQTEPLIAFALSSTPESAGMARCHVRAALEYHGLGDYASDAEIVTSELVTNALQHAGMDSTQTIAVTLMHIRSPDAVAVVVADSSPHPPVRRETTAGSEGGRGLQVIEALSVHWGWNPDDTGKEVFAVLAREEQPS